MKDSYNCDMLSLAGATAALEDQEHLRANRAKILATRARLSKELVALGYDVTPSQANFVWATRRDRPVEPIFQTLKSRGILVRYMNYSPHGDGLRITVGNRCGDRSAAARTGESVIRLVASEPEAQARGTRVPKSSPSVGDLDLAGASGSVASEKSECPLPAPPELRRETGETRISLTLRLDGTGVSSIRTGVGFFDHMLTLLAKHSLIDLTVEADGDLHVDSHHTVEDVGITLGKALVVALGDKAGIRRYGHFTLPMDETLVTVAVDLSGRAFCVWNVELPPETLGNFSAPLAGGVLAGGGRQWVDELPRRLPSRQEHASHPRSGLQGGGPIAPAGGRARSAIAGHPVDEGCPLTWRQVFDLPIPGVRLRCP